MGLPILIEAIRMLKIFWYSYANNIIHEELESNVF